MVVALVLAGVLGLCFGSFFNVVIWRLPRGENLAKPGSHCPACDATIAPRDNVPVVSWLGLRGRCRGCGERISARYPLVELLTAAGLVALVAGFGVTRELWLPATFFLLAVPMIFIDIDHRIIPNSLNTLGAVLAIVVTALAQTSALPGHLLAGVLAGGVFLIAALISPAGMGMGDVKLVGVMGLFLGVDVVPAIFVALLIGCLYGLTRLRTEGRKATVPFGPFLAVGAMAGFVVGEPVVDWYLRSF